MSNLEKPKKPRSEAQKQVLEKARLKALEKKRLKQIENAHNTISKGESVREVISPSLGTKTRSDSDTESEDESALGQNSKASSGISGVFHGESTGDHQNVLDSIGSGISGQQQPEDHVSPLPESNAGRSNQHPEQPDQSNHDRPNESGSDSGRSTPTQSDIAKLYDPAIYCSLYCREPASWKYSPKQLEFLRSCRVVREDFKIHSSDWPRNIALGAVNGVGKTQMVGDIIRYLMDTIPGCGIGFTSHVSRQCEALERYLQQHQLLPRYKDWNCVSGKLNAPNGNWARWFTAKDVGAVESLHANFMVRIVDEVKSMKDEIIDATNRWQPKLTIFLSSKGLSSGRFFDCFTTLREFWQIQEINAYDCPWISQPWIEEQIATHGQNSALVKSMITNEFSDVDLKNLVNLEMVNDILRHEPLWEDNGQIVAGLDVSAARKDGDECVIYHRKSNKVFAPWACPTSENEMEVVGRVINRLKEIKPDYLFIDKGGSGGPVAARIAEVIESENGRTKIIRTGFGDAPIDKVKYWKKNAEMYGVLMKKIVERKIILPRHDKTIGQITSRQYTVNSSGQIVLESKDTMRRRGMRSPDYADALVLCLQEPPLDRASRTMNHFDKNRIQDFRSNKMNGSHVGGRFLGNG